MCSAHLWKILKRDVSKKNEAGCQMPAEIQSESERRETFEEKKIKVCEGTGDACLLCNKY
jgi:hypothetical protein